MSSKLNSNIKLYKEPRKVNTKASEEYVHVLFKYPDANSSWDGWIPVEYRRTGVSIAEDDVNGLYERLNNVYEQTRPGNYSSWLKKQDEYWATTRAVETKEIFNLLKDGKWHCRNCEIFNPNFARRIQDLKEIGYNLDSCQLSLSRL